MPSDADHVGFGRFGETAMWILVVLTSGPLGATRLIDQVRRLDGPIGPGALFGAVARLERRGLIEPIVIDDGRRAYRLSQSWPVQHVVPTEGFSR
jgi:DNA-binding PadR family transcriptional regulator